VATRKKTAPREKKKKDFSIGGTIQTGWEIAAEHVSVLLPAVLIISAISIGFALLQAGCNLLMTAADHSDQEGVKGALTVLSLLFLGFVLIVRIVLNTWVEAGLFIIILRFATQRDAQIRDLFPTLEKTWKYFLGCLLLCLVVLGGVILLIVPGVIWGIQYQYVPYLMVDKGLSVGEAFQLSARMTQGLKWKLFLYDLCLCGVGLLGLLACCIGVVWAAVVIQVASACLYRNLLLQTDRRLAVKKVD